MAKIKVKITLTNPEKTITDTYSAIFNKETQEIIYQEKDKTIVKYIFPENTLIRENAEIRLEYHFIKNRSTQGIIYIKDLNKTLELSIKTKEIKTSKNNLKINYFIDQEEFNYKMEEIK